MIQNIEKETGTYADALRAIGWGSLAEELGVRKVGLRDLGTHFSITGEGDWNFDVPVTLGFCFVSDKNNPAPKSAQWVLDYDQERQKDEAQRDFEKAIRNSKKRKQVAIRASEEGDLVVPDPPKPELRLAKMISSMRKGWNADRELAHWVDQHPELTQSWVKAALQNQKYGNAPDLSNTQILNPATGKGVAATKTQSKSPNALPNELVDPFSEWMKLRGMWLAMLAYRSDEDFKFMVLEPGDISLEALKVVKTSLDGLALWGGIKLDIEATLRCTEILITHSAVSIRGRKPRQVIGGLRQAYFKSLGTAAALMNDALLPLPDWFTIHDKADADAYLHIIQEAIGERGKSGCLGALDENRSDEGAVLQQYRSWLATGEFVELMDFHYSFGVTMMRKAAAGDFSRLFRTEILDQLLIRTYEEKLMVKEIVENSGFKSLTRAIRNTTIYAVSLNSSDRDVQFGLAQKWKQKIKSGKGEFTAALSDFVQAHNWEVVYKLKGRGHQVTTTDLDQVFALIERHNEEIVGSLLLAYGYSRAPKTEAVDEPNEITGQTNG